MKTKKLWEVEGIEWREVRLGELTTEKPKYGLTAKAKDSGEFAFLRITDIDDKGEIKTDNFKFVDIDDDEASKYEIKQGDLLLARSGSVGNFFIAFKDYPKWVYGSYLIRFRLDTSKVNLNFVKHFLSSQYFKRWVSYQKRHGAQPNINAEEYSSFKLPLPFRNGKPDLETQKKIVEYIEENFSRIDKILEKKKKELELLDELWESILEKAFKPKEGEEWKEVRLREIAKVVSGNTAPQDKKFYENGKYLFVRVFDLGAKKNFNPITDTRDKLNDEGIKRNKLVLVPTDTIVFPKSGAAILTNSIGILGKEAYIVNHLAGVIAHKDKVLPRYLLFYLSKTDRSEYLTPDSSYPSLKLETITNLKLPLPFRNGKPDLEKQKEIVNYLDSVYEKIKILKEKIQTQIIQLEEMKQSILEEVFNHDDNI